MIQDFLSIHVTPISSRGARPRPRGSLVFSTLAHILLQSFFVLLHVVVLYSTTVTEKSEYTCACTRSPVPSSSRPLVLRHQIIICIVLHILHRPDFSFFLRWVGLLLIRTYRHIDINGTDVTSLAGPGCVADPNQRPMWYAARM